MRIAARLGRGFAVLSAMCVLLLIWLGYHEFVEEPANFAARGLGKVHEETTAELLTVCFLGLIPVVLGAGWWWTRRVLAPLALLTQAVEQIEPNQGAGGRAPSANEDEVATLTAAFASMTARLEASFQTIREFTLHASHELKTPLTVMRAQLETILSECPEAGKQGERIESLLNEVLRLAKIVDSLTLLTKAEAGLEPLERKPVPFGELVREAHDDALLLGQAQRLKVSLGECANAPLIGDRHRLRQLLLILTDNAVKYNRLEGGLQISVREQGGFAELRITNDGGGFSTETQRRLFGRFVRGENAAGKVEGCGLGLSIASWIVKTHGGSIELRPEAEGRTTAIVRLPLAEHCVDTSPAHF